MKLFKALVYAAIICLGFVGVAEAKSSGSSFRGGFSSQRHSSPKPAPSYKTPPAYNNKTSFGAFGNSKSTVQANAAATGQPSQMSRDLTGSAAQANALKTMDARTAGGTQKPADNGGNNGFRNSDKNTAPHYPPASQTVVHQTVVHQNSGGFMHGFMWFMIGHSLAQHSNTVYVPINNQAGVNQDGANQAGDWVDANGAGVAPLQDVMSANPEVKKESFFLQLLRVLLWLGVITAAVWMVRKIIKFRNRKINRNAHYSLGS